jgi:DNA mismatch endonuclease (patch repair protein)
MRTIKTKNTKHELALRRALHSQGVRYGLDSSDLPGKPDVVFRKYKLAVFVDGDMWHGNEHVRRGMASIELLFPSRTNFWCKKILNNLERDFQIHQSLRSWGLTVLRFWASEVERDVYGVANKVIEKLGDKKSFLANAKGERHEPC